MDRVTRANIETFRTEQSLPAGKDAAVLFEHFVNYCVISDAYDEEFDVEQVHTGGGNDLGIDGLAIFVNGILIDSIDEAEDLWKTNGHLQVKFVFNQAKSSSNFSGEEIVAFGDGVQEFFSESPVLPASTVMVERRAIMAWIYEHSGSFKLGRPEIELAFVTTGVWQDDGQLSAKIAKIEAELRATNLFETVTFRAYGAADIQASWSRSKNSVAAEFTFVNKATLGDIAGVSESYLGVIPLSEFLKVITDPQSGIRKHIFVDNVRDFQGDNPVNGEMTQSLSTVAGRDRFSVLNNGVTLVARQLKIVGNKFYASDYQIVNGCQTSHVLYNNQADLPGDMDIPFKVIASNDEEVISAIATATNRQTEVTDEDLFALEGFQKDLEKYMEAFEDKHKLFYERRSKQYSAASGIEKVRIISKQIEIRAFAAMFLNDAHRAARYFAALKNLVGSTIFHAGHKLDPYYTAAYAYYKLEFLFRNGAIPVKYKPARYHLLMAFRHLAGGYEMPAFSANKMTKYADQINKVLWNDAVVVETFRAACDAIDEALEGGPLTGDAVKVQAFTDKVLAKLKP